MNKQDYSVTSHVISGIFVFPDDDPVYNDHFPEAPTVPGTLIIHAFVTQIQKASCVEIAPHSLTIQRFQFRQFTSPGARGFTILFEGNRATCKLYRTSETTGRPAATGTILFSGATESYK